MQRLVDRPEARWALFAGIVGALAVAAWSSYKIFEQGTAAAGLSFVFVPLAAAVAALPAGVWGAALGHVVLHLRGRAPEPKIVFWSALVAAVMPPAVLAWELLRR
jgi:cation transporter-like permease